MERKTITWDANGQPILENKKEKDADKNRGTTTSPPKINSAKNYSKSKHQT
jgi:hypothetical protein